LTEVRTNKVLWSEETFRLFGLAPETAPVPTLDQIPTLLHSEDRTSMQSWVIACLDGNSPPALEIRTCPIDGVDRWLLWQGVLETTANGEPLRMIGTVQNITGRKLAIQRIEYLSRLNNMRSLINATIVHLEEELILFRKVCQFAVEAGKMKMAWIGILNPSSGWVEPIAWHGQGTKYLQDIRVSSFGDVPEGHGPTGICAREVHPVFEQNFATSKATALWHEQGARYGWGSSASIPLSRGGKVYATFTLYQGDSNAFDPDIKQLLSDIGSDLSFALDSLDIKADREKTKQALVDSEAKMATILENVSAYIFLKDIEGRYQYVTPNCLELWGASMEQVIGATDDSLFDATFAKIIHDNDRRVLESGEISRAEETGASINSGKVVTYLAIKIPLRRPDGSIYGLCGISTDISERIAIEEQLRQQLKELQRWYEVTLDREQRVGQLKAEVNTLLARLGEPPHYASQEPLSGVKEQ
jgi:PAS domain S-box-containing protein